MIGLRTRRRFACNAAHVVAARAPRPRPCFVDPRHILNDEDVRRLRRFSGAAWRSSSTGRTATDVESAPVGRHAAARCVSAGAEEPFDLLAPRCNVSGNGPALIGAPSHPGMFCRMFSVSVATSILAVGFAVDLCAAVCGIGRGSHLIWWAAGVAAYGVGTLAAAVVDSSDWTQVGSASGTSPERSRRRPPRALSICSTARDTADHGTVGGCYHAWVQPCALLFSPVAPLSPRVTSPVTSIDWAWVRASRLPSTSLP